MITIISFARKKSSMVIILIVLLDFPRTVANVKIVTDTSQLECGSKATLTCYSTDETHSVAWMNSNDAIPITRCTRSSCVLNPAYTRQYSFSFNRDEGVFNLTIKHVSVKDNGRKIVCSDGVNEDTQILTVRDKNYRVWLSEDSEQGLVKVSSGCVSMNMSVSFNWLKIDASNWNVSKFSKDIHFSQASHCSNEFKCGNDQEINLTDGISAERSDTGKYRIKCIVDYGNERIESDATINTYNLNEQDYSDKVGSEQEPTSSSYMSIIPIVVIGVFVVLICCCCYFCFHKRKRQHNCPHGSAEVKRLRQPGGDFQLHSSQY